MMFFSINIYFQKWCRKIHIKNYIKKKKQIYIYTYTHIQINTLALHEKQIITFIDTYKILKKIDSQ